MTVGFRAYPGLEDFGVLELFSRRSYTVILITGVSYSGIAGSGVPQTAEACPDLYAGMLLAQEKDLLSITPVHT